MVNLTRIYTRTGDDGTHAPRRLQPHEQDRPAPGGLRRHQRGQRADRRGRRRRRPARRRRPRLPRVQNDLFDVGADLCTPLAARPTSTRRCGSRTPGWTSSRPTATATSSESSSCARSSFPAGRPGAAYLHVAPHGRRGGPSAPPGPRSRAYGDQPGTEKGAGGVNRLTAKYLNRLSDLLFILARVANLRASAGTCCGSRAAGARAARGAAVPQARARGDGEGLGAAD